LSDKRKKLEVQRLTESWFYWKTISWFDELDLLGHVCNFPYVNELDSFISSLKSYMFVHFVEKWSGSYHKENCHDENCSRILVVDGNHKVNRLKCAFKKKSHYVKEVGEVETGCLNTPKRGSYFLEAHTDTANSIKVIFRNRPYNCLISQVKIVRSQKLSSKNPEIHSSFEKPDGRVFYLVSYETDAIPFWVSRKQIPST
jgi:hypothetical protein